MKRFSIVIYHHSLLITIVILFYNTELQQYHGLAENYHGLKFYNISPALLAQRHFVNVPFYRRYDIQHNGIQHNDTQHNDIQHNVTQHTGLVYDTQHK
jgi:hypothetical protein